MRNTILAAVSAVALLGSAPEANAVAALTQAVIGTQTYALTPYMVDDVSYYYAPHGQYWAVFSPTAISGVTAWQTYTHDGQVFHVYGVAHHPTMEGMGLFVSPHNAWGTYGYYVVPSMMDAVWDNAVRSPYKETSADQTTVK